jgi:hypothetical protein
MENIAERIEARKATLAGRKLTTGPEKPDGDRKSHVERRNRTLFRCSDRLGQARTSPNLRSIHVARQALYRDAFVFSALR